MLGFSFHCLKAAWKHHFSSDSASCRRPTSWRIFSDFSWIIPAFFASDLFKVKCSRLSLGLFNFSNWVHPVLKHPELLPGSAKSKNANCECQAGFSWCLSTQSSGGDGTNLCLYLPLQAVPGAAASHGVGACGRGPHWAQAQLLCGQRWCPAGCQAAAARSGLWASPASVRLRGACTACVQQTSSSAAHRKHIYHTNNPFFTYLPPLLLPGTSGLHVWGRLRVLNH